MIEIHLNSEVERPYVERRGDTLCLIMRPEITINDALKICKSEIPKNQHGLFKDLYSERQIKRDFDLHDGVLIIRYARTNES